MIIYLSAMTKGGARSTRAAQLTVDLGALGENYQTMRDKSAGAETAAVVKADAYGLGLAHVVPELLNAGTRVFFVAQEEEGHALRALTPDADIYVLNGLPPGAAADFAAAALRPCLISLDQISEWQTFCRTTQAHPACVFVDTGFNRLGLDETDLLALHADPTHFDGWTLALIASHLACADNPEHPMNRAQLEKFRYARDLLPPAPASLANSGGVLMGADFCFDMTRIGISLYGGSPHANHTTALSCVVRLDAPILQTRTLGEGDTVGYGATFTAAHDMTIGIVGLGYGDGVLRSLGSRDAGLVRVAIDGHDVPIVGRVSMDTLAVDLTDLDEMASPGDMVEIFGPNNPIDRLATQGQTLSYELLTGLGGRYNRIYTGN